MWNYSELYTNVNCEVSRKFVNKTQYIVLTLIVMTPRGKNCFFVIYSTANNIPMPKNNDVIDVIALGNIRCGKFN